MQNNIAKNCTLGSLLCEKLGRYTCTTVIIQETHYFHFFCLNFSARPLFSFDILLYLTLETTSPLCYFEISFMREGVRLKYKFILIFSANNHTNNRANKIFMHTGSGQCYEVQCKSGTSPGRKVVFMYFGTVSVKPFILLMHKYIYEQCVTIPILCYSLLHQQYCMKILAQQQGEKVCIKPTHKTTCFFPLCTCLHWRFTHR